MRCSVFTPTHDVRYLDRAHASLRAQTHLDWEWVLLPNNGAQIPATIAADPRVLVLPAVAGMGIGALKRRAASAGRGELLVELDHDDWLAPEALARLAAALVATGAGFLYSDFIGTDEQGQVVHYAPGLGWFTDGPVTRSFPLSPAMLRSVHYAPNHVRAWTAAAYHAVGGHDPALPVGDDHDLICRTYLAGVPFVHIPEPLYHYSERAQETFPNSYRRLQATLWRIEAQLEDLYTEPLIREWCRRQRLAIDADTHPEDLAPGRATGWIDLGDRLTRVPPERLTRVLDQAWETLVPGGWLRLCLPPEDGDPRRHGGWTAQTLEQLPRWSRTLGGHRTLPRWKLEHRPDARTAYYVALKGQPQPGVDPALWI